MEKLRVRENAPEIEVTRGGKVFKYARSEEGEGMRLVEVEGEFKTHKSVLLERLKNASRVDCAVCLHGELWSKITQMMWWEFC